jgi:hypothetical protein
MNPFRHERAGELHHTEATCTTVGDAMITKSVETEFGCCRLVVAGHASFEFIDDETVTQAVVSMKTSLWDCFTISTGHLEFDRELSSM